MGVQIRIKNGQITAEINGVVGPACEQHLKKIADMLKAKLESVEHKEEFYQDENLQNDYLTNDNS